jgi:hypothetical protein
LRDAVPAAARRVDPELSDELANLLVVSGYRRREPVGPSSDLGWGNTSL